VDTLWNSSVTDTIVKYQDCLSFYSFRIMIGVAIIDQCTSAALMALNANCREH